MDCESDPTITNSHVLSGLIRKRQEIAAELDAAQSRVRQLVLDIDAVDATIRLFQPDIDLDVVKVRPTPRRHEAHRGDTSRLILSLLREAGEPLSHREITQRVMTARGLNLTDRALCQTMRDRVGASLRGMRERGALGSGEGNGPGVRWNLL
jgi:hypothetical protein